MAWACLRNRQLLGLKFRRQVVIEGFIVDFYCPEFGIALEIDGPIHLHPENVKTDARRSKALERVGVSVLRLSNDEVQQDNLAERILDHLPSSFRPP